MRGKPIIFISSTSDMAREREALAAALRPSFQPYLFEEDTARTATPEARCRDMIHKSDAFVGCLGIGYGTAFDGTGDGPSISEWEYDTARAHGGLEVLIFIAQETNDPERVDHRQRKFLERVSDFRKGHWCKHFGSPGELTKLALDALHSWFIGSWIALKSAEEKASWMRKVFRVMGAVIGIPMAVGTGVLWARGDLSEPIAAVSCMILFSIIAGMAVLELR
jgi:hypothetical protein